MILSWPEIKERIAVPGQDGHYLPACTGVETDEELRGLVLQLARNCNPAHSHAVCLFRPLLGLSYPALHQLITGMSRQACLDLLEEERRCRASHRGHNCQAD